MQTKTRRPKSPALSVQGLGKAICELFDHLENVQFWIKDRHCRYCWVNRGFLMNYSLEKLDQVLGKTDFDLSPAHLADQYQVDDARVLRGKAIRGRVELVGRFDHTASWSVTDKLPVRNQNGRIVGTVGITRPAQRSPKPLDGGEANLGRVIGMIRSDSAASWSNRILAKAANLSVRAFERHFRAKFGMTPHQYILRLRVRLASHALVYSSSSLAEIAASQGFADQSHFTREFRRETGLAPGAYRKRYATR